MVRDDQLPGRSLSIVRPVSLPHTYMVMIMKMKKLALAIAMSQFATLGSATAYSQMLEEVVVTARKKAESLMDAPVAVTVVSGASMDRDGITNLEQLATKVPGLQLGRAAQTSSI